MKSRHAVLALMLAGAVAAGCSKSSTGPSDPYVGTWSVHIYGVTANEYITPSPWNIAIGKSGTTYTATYPNLTWGLTSPASTFDVWSDTGSTFGIMAGTMQLHVQDVNAPPCQLNIVGTFVGDSVSGIANAAGTMCAPGSWPFWATKQ